MNLSKHQENGTIYGRLVWRGKTKPKDEKITTPLKKQWKLLSLPDYRTFGGTDSEIRTMIPPVEEPVVAGN